MEYHKYFFKIAETESVLLDTITSSNISIDCVLSSIVKDYKDSSKFSSVIKNLKVLRLLLCHQYKLNYNQGTECRFNSRINEFIEILYTVELKEVQSTIYDIVILILIFQDKKTLIETYKNFQAFYLSSQFDTSLKIPINRNLKILLCYLMTLELLYFLDSENKLIDVNSENLNTIQEVYTNAIMNDIKIWMKSNEKYDWYYLYQVLEKIIIISKSHKILSSCVLEILDHDIALSGLCVLCDLIFPVKCLNKEVDYSLIHNKNLWLTIQNKVISNFSQERKQALYLFQKICDFIEEHEKNIRESHSLSSEKFTPFIYLQNDLQKFPINEVKTNFILVMEAFEEKQQHLVLPVMPFVNNLIEIWAKYKTCKDCFHLNWIYCIFVRLFEHDSNVIVKWGLLKSLKLDTEAYHSNVFLTLIVKNLNNTFLFEKSEDEKDPQIVNSLTTWFNNIQNDDFHLIEKFINLVNQVQWNPVSIFHVLQSILLVSEIVEASVNLQPEQLSSIRSLMETNLKWHPLMLRSMSHVTLIEIFLRFTNIHSLRSAFSFLSNFPTKDIREPSCWLKLTSKLAKVDLNNVVNFIAQVCKNLKEDDENLKIPISTFSISIQSLHEAKVIFQTEKCVVIQELSSLFMYLDKVDIRPYVKISGVFKIIKLIHSLINADCILPNFIYKLFDNYQETIWKFLVKLMICDDLQYEHIEICTQILLNISFGRLKNISVRHSKEYEKQLEEKCIKVLGGTVYQCNQLQLLYVLKLWSSISHLHKYENEFFYKIIEVLLKLCKFKTHENELTRKVSSECFIALSLLIHNHIVSLKANDFKNKNWFDIMSLILDAAGNEVLIHFTNTLRHCAFVFKNDYEHLKKIEILVKSFWKCNFGGKRDKLFWLVTQNLTKCINSSNFLNCKALQHVSEEFNNHMLIEGDKLPGLKFILLIYSDVDKHFDNLTNVILNGLLHGQALRRDQRIYLQTCLKGKQILSPYKLKDGETDKFDAYDFLNRQCNVDVAIRAAAVLQLCKVLHTENNNAAMFLPLVLEKLLAIRNKRYFANSYLHRLKHRIMQVLLILQPYLDQNSSQILYSALKDSVMQDSEQQSVLLLKKWILIRIYLSNRSALSDLWLFFNQICEERPNSASFIIEIVWHVAHHLTQEELSIFVAQALTKLGNCCMGQQFSMRLYGQLFFIKLYELLNEDPNIQKEYASLYQIILDSFNNNSKKHPVKVDDFFYTIFDPVKHYTLETIYYQLPRISKVCFEEWITRENYEEVFLNKSNIDISICNKDNSEYDTITSVLISNQVENINEEIELNGMSADVQKKILPKKSLAPNEDQIEQIFSELNIDVEKKRKDIIVVATLVEKSQNLGGIARTCEIFSSRELIISNIKQTEDKEFQVLSVSADRWLKISEIKPDSLCKYLIELKEKGWSIVGAEQTVNSVNLIDFKFPKQTVLVLGNEKSGIPANILPVLDICVEIPQQGVVRSLNVHVTSAICVWEYVKQHQF